MAALPDSACHAAWSEPSQSVEEQPGSQEQLRKKFLCTREETL
jgi:hypothetical protein